MLPFASFRSLLGIRDFRRYYLGQTMSVFGDSLTPLAIAFAVLELTGSPGALGLVVLSSRLPMILLSLLGGAVGDRVSRRQVMLITDCVRFLSQGVTAALLLTGHASIWAIAVLQLVAGAGSAFFNPAAQGLVASLVPKDKLTEANSLLGISRSTGQILALGLSGALVATAGSGWSILIDAFTFAVSAYFLFRLPRTLAAERLERRKGLLGSVGQGLAAVRTRGWLCVWILHVSLANMIVISPTVVLGPFIADKFLGGAPSWSAIGICYAIGGLAGGIVSARVKPRRPLVAAALWFFAMAPFPALLALHGWVPLIAVAGLAAGLQQSVYAVLQTTTLQQNVPGELIARASSVSMLGSLIGAPVGMALAGPAAVQFGARSVLVFATVTVVVISTAALLIPAAWRLVVSRPEEQPTSEDAAEAKVEA
ncbi:MFS transporter [Streptomyces sp. NPDC004546]|uniref:MFS transporter n=1 Tax=Streptomyces sp. NPDC004546 TaxID=3154282 RepID=UPI0033AD003C